MPRTSPPISVQLKRVVPSRWDCLALVLVLLGLLFLAETSRQLLQPLSGLQATPLSLDPSDLPMYAARTTLRMLAAMAFSLLFTFTFATWAAKSARAERILIPMLDILQSVPILGFISVTVVFFMALAPGRVLGAEFAAIFAIFTSQAWNMAFSFYQSLRTVPHELTEAARCFQLSPWMRFWRLEVPFAMPGLVWNMMMSMSGGWFFVVASESISVGSTAVTLPGVGSYIALAIAHQDFNAIGWAIVAMAAVILTYDQLLFRPLVAWSDRFRSDQERHTPPPRSWVLTVLRRSRIVRNLRRALHKHGPRISVARPRVLEVRGLPLRLQDTAWTGIAAALALLLIWYVIHVVRSELAWQDVFGVVALGLVTMVRVFVLIALATLVWVPVGVWIGLRPRAAQISQPIAQFLAAFPANLMFPIAVSAIVAWHLNADVWLSPLMILGTQWYILFNVIAGATTLPRDMQDAAANLQVTGWLWWRRVALPAVLPYYVTGAITASGGSWNAAIVAEAVSWGPTHLSAHGIGSYIAQATSDGDFHRIVLGIAIMAGFVVLLNRVFWRPMYHYVERRCRLD
ncbi:MAG TPA: ABC transporter permease subunit [Nevskiaceae bacterium]|nr:ABC transporter permease subunit [Nevskiaceae bacterium]